jgi:RHS repeat-associated protein
MNNKTIKLIVMLLGLATAQWAHATDWSADEYDLYSGDFNGDGKGDILYVARDPAKISGIAISDGSAPNITWQTWPSNYLGIPWSGNLYNVIVADFNGDAKADIFLQRATAGDSYLLLADGGGKIIGISQTIANGALGLMWSADQHKLIAGDINNDGKADLFLQATSSSGTHAVVLADATGTFTIAPTQTWSEGYLGLNWSTQSANVFLGDFNGDHLSDLLVQAKPKWVMIDYDITFPVPTYPPNMNGVVYSQAGATPYQLVNTQTWSRMNNGVDWSPLTNTLLVGDFNGDGRTDILFQAKYSSGTNYLLNGNASGAAFPAAATAITSSTIPLSSDSNKLVVGNFDGGAATGLYLQALTSAGANYTVNSVSSTVNASSHNPSLATGTVPATAAGRTPTAFNIGNTGDANYTIPISVPPALGNLQLKLALVYNSRTPNGIVGVGWNISGLSAITRCNKTYAQDGAPGPVTLQRSTSYSDRFCLDGKQLKLTSGAGSYGYPGSTYGTEFEMFSLVTAGPSSIGNGPASFTVTTNNGLIYTYGGTVDSEIFAGSSGTIRTWALSKITDRSGNAISLVYQNDTQNGDPTQGSYRIDRITYPTTSTGLGPYYQVKFTYGARPANDIPSAYVAGYLVKEVNQLNGITTSRYSSGAVIKQYNLGYTPSTTTNRNTLTAVQECSASTCLPATTISYQSGIAGFSSSPTVTYNSGYALLFADLDGDARPDAIYASNTTHHIFVAFALQTSGWQTPIDTGFIDGLAGPYVQSQNYMHVGSFLGNGQQQLLVPQTTGYFSFLRYDVSSGTFAMTPTSLPNGVVTAADCDADGLDDVIAAIGSGGSTGGTIVVYRNTTILPGSVQFGTPNTIWTIPSTQTFNSGGGWLGGAAVGVTVSDFNGDGRADVLATTFDSDGNFYTTSLISNGAYASFTPGPTFLAHDTAGTGILNGGPFAVPIDWNGDGCTDVVVPDGYLNMVIQISNCAGNFTAITTPLTPNNASSISGTLASVDWDGDGRMDLMYINKSDLKIHILMSTGINVGADVSTGVQTIPGKTSYGIADLNGDGLADLLITTLYSTSPYVSYTVYEHSGASNPPDLAMSFTDGFGMFQRPIYVPLTNSSYYSKYATAPFPEQDYIGALYVVGSFTASDGTGGNYSNTFSYYGARTHRQGRGFEGFSSRKLVDSRMGLSQYIYFNQTFPYTGLLSATTINQSNGYSVQTSANTYANNSFGSGSETRVAPYNHISTVNQYEYQGPLNGQLVTQTTTTTSVDSYNNPTNIVISKTDSSLSSPFYGQVFTSTALTTFNNDTTNWCIGLPLTASITNAVPGQSTQTRSTSYSVDGSHCRITQKVEQPGPSALTVTTDYGFGTTTCPGDLTSITVTGSNPNGTAMSPRITSYNYGYSTGRCQLPEQIINPLGQPKILTYNYDFGIPLSSKDPNNLTTSWTLDDYGRQTLETRPDNTSTQWAYNYCVSSSCWGLPDLRFLVKQYERDTVASTISEQDLFYDGFDRLRSDQSNRVLGTWTVGHQYVYDGLGRMTVDYLPFSGSSNGYTAWSYDALNRATAMSLYTSVGAIDRSTTFSYAGRTTTITDPLLNTTQRVTDVSGRLRKVIDPSPGGTTQYAYDVFGNLNQTIDATGVTSSATYNLRGFRTQMVDADAGTWNFAADSLNELVSWTDAKAQQFGQIFDVLGRITSRTEPEGVSTWTWGNSAAAHNIGALASVSGYGYAESLTYDSVSRLSNRSITTDQNYQFDYTYNNIGRLATLAYPTSPMPASTGPRYKIQYLYSYGEPYTIQDVTNSSTPTTIWQLGAVNDSSLPLTESIGVGTGATTVTSTYNSWTNQVLSIRAGVGGSLANRQNLTYLWDVNNNLTQRQDLNQALTEHFTLDSLNRLTASTLNAVQNLSVGYNPAGNINSRSDVGTFTYGNTAHPHGVTTAGSNSYTYDANGNVASRNGLANTWASFNLPTVLQASVSGSTLTSQFLYGPEHQRFQQISTELNGTETTRYVNRVLEKMTASTTGLTYWRHYVNTPTGRTIIVSRNSDLSTSTNLILSDHLGSSDVIINGSTGALNVQESFSPFGLRRQSNWAAGVPSSWNQVAVSQSTRHGFTSHEHLDNVGLIHMNGRVYDPLVGRFLSVDTDPGTPGESQTHNPYSYVSNRPLVATDPTGFADLFLDSHQNPGNYDYRTTNPGSFLYIIYGAVPGGTGITWANALSVTSSDTTGNKSNTAQQSAAIVSSGTNGSAIPFGGQSDHQTAGKKTELEEIKITAQGLPKSSQPLKIQDWQIALPLTVPATLLYNMVISNEQNLPVLKVIDAAVSLVVAPEKELAETIAISAAKSATTVIGRTKDLKNLAAGERSLLDRLTPDLGSAKANWARNSGVLREEMGRGLPIRDLSPGNTAGEFLNAERALLRDRGWSFNPQTNFWMPPLP